MAWRTGITAEAARAFSRSTLTSRALGDLTAAQPNLAPDVATAPRWWAFWAWGVIGALGAVSVAGAASVGVVLMPVVAVLAAAGARLLRRWPETIGLAAGIAVVALFLAYVARDHVDCEGSSSQSYVARGGSGHTVGCGGIAPGVFVVVGLTLGMGALVAYRYATRPARADDID